jgi:hypothetical protein
MYIGVMWVKFMITETRANKKYKVCYCDTLESSQFDLEFITIKYLHKN